MSGEQGPCRKMGMQAAEGTAGRRQTDHCARGSISEAAT